VTCGFAATGSSALHDLTYEFPLKTMGESVCCAAAGRFDRHSERRTPRCMPWEGTSRSKKRPPTPS